jgi:hypothetical protein
VWSPNANSSLLGVVAISARCKTHSTMVPCWKSTSLFPQASPLLPPFQPHMPTDVTQFLLWEDDIGTSEAFSIRLGLKQKCSFRFSRKAKIKRNFAKIENFRKNL